MDVDPLDDLSELNIEDSDESVSLVESSLGSLRIRNLKLLALPDKLKETFSSGLGSARISQHRHN